jgi:hypothetical protein
MEHTQRVERENSGATHFWESRIECVTAPSQWALAKKINDFYAGGKWVVGTQTFAPRYGDSNWTAFIYFKIKA